MLLPAARKLLYLRCLALKAADELNLSSTGNRRIGSSGKKLRCLTGQRVNLGVQFDQRFRRFKPIWQPEASR
jgi:hypothetical protein